MHGPSRPVKIASVSDKGHKSWMLDMYIINRLSIMTIKSETGIQKLVASAIDAKGESRHHTVSVPSGSHDDPCIAPKTTP